nr:TRAP transporter small permease [Amylibacter sp.]
MSTPLSDTRSPVGHPDLPEPLRHFERGVTFLVNLAFGLATICVLVDLFLLGASVVARYMITRPITWSDEIVALSLTAITMLAAPKVLLDKGHIEVDILTEQAQGTLAIVIRLWSSLAVLAVALLLIFNGWFTAMFSRMIGLLTEGYLELPLWIFQLLLPLGGVLLLPVILLQIAQTLFVWRSTTSTKTASPDTTDEGSNAP